MNGLRLAACHSPRKCAILKLVSSKRKQRQKDESKLTLLLEELQEGGLTQLVKKLKLAYLHWLSGSVTLLCGLIRGT